MMNKHRIFLFGDSADAPIPMVQQLLATSRHSKNTQYFIRKAVDAVSWELQNLTPLQRDTLGAIHSLQDLQDCYTNGQDRFGIARLVLTYVARIGELILHAETDPSLLICSNDAPSTVALGISGSLLPAAAAVVANDVRELIEVATYLTRVTCRMAVHIAQRGIEIEDDPGSWAFSVLGQVVSQLPALLHKFHQDQAIPHHRQAYIGIQTASWATIFGPPSVLKELIRASATLRGSEIVPNSAVFGPAHAVHLATPNIFDMIGETSMLESKVKPNCRIISGSKNKHMQCLNLRDLLKDILKDIFQYSSNPDLVFEGGIPFLDRSKKIDLFVLGNTAYLLPLRRILKSFKVSVKFSRSMLNSLKGHDESDLVAIVGMSGRFPGSDNIDDLWTTIMERKEMHKKIPHGRFDADKYFDGTGRSKNCITTTYGCFLEHPGHFDHKMFNVSPREAIQLDPGHRLLMHTTYEALENAGVTNLGSNTTDSKSISTFVGLGTDDWREVQEAVGVDIYMTQGTQRAFAPGRLHHYFGWEGATTCVDSACGSAATAVGMAYKALISRDCGTAVAGGANIIATPFWHSTLSQGGFLSTTGGCKTFREDADGYCRGEAVGILVMKRLDDALRDNDNIKAVIRGYARNHSAESTSITHPHPRTQERLYRSLLHKTGLEPHDIDYVECHGTGTIAGDSAELESVANVLAKSGSRERPLVVGAVKANVGHSEAAAAIPSIVKAAMMFQKAIIPPQVGVPQKLGQYPCLRNGQIHVPSDPVPFSVDGERSRRILVNNFDAAGGNSCFVLEEPARQHTKGLDPRPYHVVACSAHSSASLFQNKKRTLQFLTEADHIDLASLAYTTTARRRHHALRAAFCGQNIQEISKALEEDLNKNGAEANNRKEKPPLIFTFSGQGGQYIGMGRELFQCSHQFRQLITNMEQMCCPLGFPRFASLISGAEVGTESVSVLQMHLALVGLQIALTDLWKLWGIQPDIVVGHSIGEYAALYAAGVLSMFDALYLVGKRAELIQTKCVARSHAMLSISGNTNELSLLLSSGVLKGCEISCFNSPSMIVVSGEQRQVSKAQSLVRGQGIKCQMLDIDFGMHSSQMDAIIPEFRGILAGVRFDKPKVKFVSTMLGNIVTEASIFTDDYLISQTRYPVKFRQAMAYLVAHERADTRCMWLEIGPSASCLGIVRANIDIHTSNALASLRKGENNWKTIATNLGAFYTSRMNICWREYHKSFIECLSLIDLPHYVFDTRDFWITFKGSNPQADPEDPSYEPVFDPEPLSTCVHHCLQHIDDEEKSSASFITTISYVPLMRVIMGHKLSGTALCSAGIFIDMAFTAARYLTTDGHMTTTYPMMSARDLQIVHPIVPDTEPEKIVQIDIARHKHLGTELLVSFSDHSKRSSPAIGNCVVRIANRSALDDECQNMWYRLEPKVTKLLAALDAGLADRIRGKVFYTLFSHVMRYSEIYQHVEKAIISEDYKEILIDCRLPPHDERQPDQKFTLSPYWFEVLAQSVGFLLNGNPDLVDDLIYIGSHVDRIDLDARNYSPDVSYRVFAYIEHLGGIKYWGNAYLLFGDTIIGILEGLRLSGVPRSNLQRILGQGTGAGKTDTLQITDPSTTTISNPNQTLGNLTPHDKTVARNKDMHPVPLTSAFLKSLFDETGLLKSEVAPSVPFFELGVDSLMSLSINAAFKAHTGIELGASFLINNPTLDDAQRALRIMENQMSTTPSCHGMMNGHKAEEALKTTTPSCHGIMNGDKAEKASGTIRSCNVVLMSGPGGPPSQTPLFFLVDGAGSAAAYVHLPELPRDRQVFAVESPWVNDPENFTCAFSEAAAHYIAAIRAKQPDGPYLLGGWSAGGVFAYEVARILLCSGETVHGLIIIDMPAPRNCDRSRVAVPTSEIIHQMGMLAGIERTTSPSSPQSQDLKQHMLSTVKCFSNFDPTPMTPDARPHATFVLWATEQFGRTHHAHDDVDLNASSTDAWFYPSQHDFGPNGWDGLVGGTVECFEVQGDHFSIMHPPLSDQLGQLLQHLVSRYVNAV